MHPMYASYGESVGNNSYEISNKGLEFIIGKEGFRKFAYPDHDGKWTIGFGHVLKHGESYPNGITRQQVLDLLRKDITERITSKSLDPFLKKNNILLTDNQYDALVSFTYNNGEYIWNRPASNFELKRLHLGKNFTPQQIENAMTPYHWATDPKKGKWESLGLWRRRMDEAEFGDYKCWDNRPAPPGSHLLLHP